ncbi:L-type lectin-domain containing receptor kinase VII.1-like [Impatiens glandulifera]|uniref:L-type lectin-domain containing receptor kinase VII.1-like n=1 Tax=Impatiens glandulifera TaxID=253017 RepID=UPI001FB0A17B|nr:L-type lectin-domain containing receptor kinase VII.1-like [Impatiens glandulifera]
MEDRRKPPFLLLLLSLSLVYLRPILAVDFVFNGFNSSGISVYGDAITKSNILTLTNHTAISMGRALYPLKIRSKQGINSSVVLPFSTSFIFAMGPLKGVLPGHGLVFLFVPFTGIIMANPAQNLGFLNRTVNGNPNNHIFGVEFDVFKNPEFDDIDDNHVGIDVNSLTSITSHAAGYFKDGGNGDPEKSFNNLQLNNGKNYQVWIDFRDSEINVTMAVAGQRRPSKPLISTDLNLSNVLEDEMYVGFTAATGRLVESHHILAWSFSNSNFSIHEELITTGLPSFVLPKDPIYKSKGFIAGMTVGLFFFLVLASSLTLFLINRNRRKAREKAEMEEWELEYWPHRIPYQEIYSATKGFSENLVIGTGGNGKVYKGVLRGGVEVAVKRISSDEYNEGMREFLAEITSLGRLKHRNLVGLRGWCKKEKGSLILVYDYMENGSLDKKIFENGERFLGYEDRVRILKDVASGVLYLHEGWESKVLHRDIKSSNVLLDKEMNGRLGDFGLARMHAHGQVANTTRVVGTIGYLAPEVIRSGRASTQTDVFGFGVLILEVLSGRRPIEDGNVSLVNWVWELMERGEVWKAIDERIRVREDDAVKMEEAVKVMGLGLMCAHPDEGERPTMRQVVKVLEGGGGGGGKEDGDESEEMDMYLLGGKSKSKSKAETGFMFRSSGGRGGKEGEGEGSGSGSWHPTFEDMKQSISTSMVSLTWSDVAVEPR